LSRDAPTAMAIQASANLDPIASVICQVVALLEQSDSSATRSWCDSVFTHACRQIECFIDPEVSVAAAEVASQRGYDLSKQRWGFQDHHLVDGERKKLFHWEHVLPVAELKRRTISLGQARSTQSVSSLLAQSDIAWILKTENDVLDKGIFRHQRPGDPWDAYRALGIRIRGKPW
jgi:hypothetical protein